MNEIILKVKNILQQQPKKNWLEFEKSFEKLKKLLQ